VASPKGENDAGIYFPLFLVLFASPARYAVYYLSADLQAAALFAPRVPLSETARRAGWQGFIYNLKALQAGAIVKLLEMGAASSNQALEQTGRRLAHHGRKPRAARRSTPRR